MGWGYNEWRPYVSVGAKLNKARKTAAAQAKKEKRQPQPVEIVGKKIATTFWGKAWCSNLEAYQDFSNRLPRGATYVRNGSVVDLIIKRGVIEAIVAGSDPYRVKITIKPLDGKRWKAVKKDCSESISSLLDLLSGKLSDGVMTRLTDKTTGLFPAPAEISMSCSCPDYSAFCKHLAAVMYGIGSRFDKQPQMLFELRGVDHQELATQAMASGNLSREFAGTASELDGQDLSAMFGIELDSGRAAPSDTGVAPKRGRKTSARNIKAIEPVSPAKKASRTVTKKPSTKAKRKPQASAAIVALSVDVPTSAPATKRRNVRAGITKAHIAKKSAAPEKAAAVKEAKSVATRLTTSPRTSTKTRSSAVAVKTSMSDEERIETAHIIRKVLEAQKAEKVRRKVR